MSRTGQLEMLFGQQSAEERAAAWVADARSFIEHLAAGTHFTADDLRDGVGDPPAHGDASGAVIARASREGLIRAVGLRKSSRPQRHRARLTVWEVTPTS